MQTTSQTQADIAEKLEALRDRMARAETGEEFAEICRLEAEVVTLKTRA